MSKFSQFALSHPEWSQAHKRPALRCELTTNQAKTDKKFEALIHHLPLLPRMIVQSSFVE
jgi:hypothetical protein